MTPCCLVDVTIGRLSCLSGYFTLLRINFQKNSLSFLRDMNTSAFLIVAIFNCPVVDNLARVTDLPSLSESKERWTVAKENC